MCGLLHWKITVDGMANRSGVAKIAIYIEPEDATRTVYRTGSCHSIGLAGSGIGHVARRPSHRKEQEFRDILSIAIAQAQSTDCLVPLASSDRRKRDMRYYSNENTVWLHRHI